MSKDRDYWEVEHRLDVHEEQTAPRRGPVPDPIERRRPRTYATDTSYPRTRRVRRSFH